MQILDCIFATVEKDSGIVQTHVRLLRPVIMPRIRSTCFGTLVSLAKSLELVQKRAVRIIFGGNLLHRFYLFVIL